MGFTPIPLPCTLAFDSRAVARGGARTGVEGHDGMGQQPVNVGCIMGSEKYVSGGDTERRVDVRVNPSTLPWALMWIKQLPAKVLIANWSAQLQTALSFQRQNCSFNSTRRLCGAPYWEAQNLSGAAPPTFSGARLSKLTPLPTGWTCVPYMRGHGLFDKS
jgi:hypothetical protein